MIDRRADDRQAHGDVYAGLETEHLHRAVALIVIHRQHDVEVASPGAEKQRVGRQRALNVPAAGASLRDRWFNLGCLLAVAEEAAFARVWIDRADPDARMGDARAFHRGLRALDRTEDEAGFDLRDRVN